MRVNYLLPNVETRKKLRAAWPSCIVQYILIQYLSNIPMKQFVNQYFRIVGFPSNPFNVNAFAPFWLQPAHFARNQPATPISFFAL
jgi:hypothetical protein